MLSKEVRQLARKWSGGGWPKYIEWVEISGLRGWTGQRVEFRFPIVAIVGENGVGKSTILQAAASSYQAPPGEQTFYPSDFFPATAWENFAAVQIRYSVREGDTRREHSVRRTAVTWRGNPDRRVRPVRYLDLRRTQPIAARVGYSRLAKSNIREASSELFDEIRLKRFSTVIGKQFDSAKYALTTVDQRRKVPVVSHGGRDYSAFHQGAGENAVADLVALEMPRNGLVLIDEIETSLHPRAQRRLIRDLAEVCRTQEVQIIVTTHSPYILDELPAEARVLVFNSAGGKQIVSGVTSDFALTKMDEENHPEVEVYVEDHEAKILLEEILYKHRSELFDRVSIVPFGAASVGKALGQMVVGNRFPRPTLVILDGDQDQAPGCLLLPGGDAPERVVLTDLQSAGWPHIAERLNRSYATLADSAVEAMTLPDHHDWVHHMADRLRIGSYELWRAMASAWVTDFTSLADVEHILTQIEEVLPA